MSELKTAPQYIYQPNSDGSFTVFSIVYRYKDRYEYKNYVAEASTEPEAISIIIRMMGLI